MSPVSIKGVSLPTFFYEMYRTLVSVPVLVVMVLIAILSLGIIASYTENAAPPAVTDEYSAFAYYEPGQEHLNFYISDNYGRSVAGVSVLAQLQVQNGNNLSAPLANLTGTSGPDGLIELTGHLWPNNTNNYQVNTTLTDPHMPDLDGNGHDYVSLNLGFRCDPIGQGQLIQIGWGNNAGISFLYTVRTGTSNSAPNALQLFYPGSNGTAPWGDQVRYFLTTENNPKPRPANETILVGNLTAQVQSFPLIIQGYSSSGQPPTMIVEVFSPQGTLLSATNVNAQSFYPVDLAQSAPSYVFDFVGDVMALFIPLMAIIAAYTSYGKDRASGTIEAVLAQPISREGLVISRYLAVLGSLAIALGIAAVVIDGFTGIYAGGYLPLADILALYSALFLVAATYTGLLFLFSHLLRTTGGVIGASVGVYMLFGLIWSTLITLVVANALGLTLGTRAYTALAINLQFLSPAGVLPLTQTLVLGGLAFFSTAPINLASYGVTPVTVGLAGLAWVLVPLALLLYLVKTRD